jgi:hypothetical protein
MSAPRLLLAGGAIVALIGGLWLWPGRARQRPAETAAAPAEAPRLAQRDYPSSPAAPAPPAAQPTQAAPTAPVQPPPPAQVINTGGEGPAPSPKQASAWAIDYRDAVCACHTRSCVRDLQGAFVRQLGAMAPGDENDVQKYSEATHAAIKCYYALPEGS